MVVVVMTTYNPEPEAPRFDYAARCLVAWHRYLRGPGAPPKYLLADDGSPHLLPLMGFAQIWSDVTWTTGEHNGIGASLNRALDTLAPDEPWIYTTDDWLLTEPLDLALPLWLITQGYDIVRLGPIHPNLYARVKFTAGHGWWLDLDTFGGGYVFATRPFLAVPSLLERVGPFQEGVDAYVCERDYSDRFMHAGCKAAAINLAGPWEHIGEYEVGDRPVAAFSDEKGGAS